MPSRTLIQETDGAGDGKQQQQKQEEEEEKEGEEQHNPSSDDIDSHHSGTPIKLLPLHDIYSATDPCGIVVAKKVRATRKLALIEEGFDVMEGEKRNGSPLPEVVRVYSRKKQKKEQPLLDSQEQQQQPAAAEKELANSETYDEEGFIDTDEVDFSSKKRRVGNSELVNLGVGSNERCELNNGHRARESHCKICTCSVGKSKQGGSRKRKRAPSSVHHVNKDDCRAKKWFWLAVDGVDPAAFVGLNCKVYWHLDDKWYKGSIVAYVSKSKRHCLKYDDGELEDIILKDEQVKFHISKDEMKKLNLKGETCMEDEDPDYSQLVVLAADVDKSREPEPGDIIWAKLAGYSMWPAVIMEDSLASDVGLSKTSGGKSIPVQFFGTHDFARIQVKQIVSFVKGLASCFHLKCKTTRFLRSLREAKTYLSEQKLPKSMVDMQGTCEGVQNIDTYEASWKNEDSSNAIVPTKFYAHKLLSDRYQNMPNGFRPVTINWKDIDRCNVCHMDDEYENNLFLQCDKCRMMIHARCYGEEFVEGVLWLCKLCRVGAPASSPPCSLCPVVGGAMKPTTDGYWAHLACAIWIPETCLSDIKRMEPIDGLSRINRDRWKLVCSICGVPYGACIQCSNNSCRVAYHPLCARAAGFCVELEDEDMVRLIPVDEDDKDHCVRLLSFCKKHKQPSNGRPTMAVRIRKNATHYASDSLQVNESGCARCEPYDYSARRGRKAPDILAAVSAKRLFIENRPYLVGGFSQHDSLARIKDKEYICSKLDASQNILSMVDKYKYMKETVKKRLTFGKSRIHGFGIFAKQQHKAGDMVIEYTGEIVRPEVADRRERLIYNSLVGAGTYMFRIDDEQVIDATKAGSIAHLINHSCEPNCHSRVITVCGDQHIIIFAKRDITQLEELTYDYRFFSIDERLPCYCGVDTCRGVVNDIEAEEQVSKLCVPRNELRDWEGE